MNSNVAYRNNGLPIEDRLRDLVARMSPGEKLSQLTSAWVYELTRDGTFSVDRAQEKIGHGIGEISRVGGASDVTAAEYPLLANAIQRFLIQHTRLGIPALVHEESCNGLMTRGATIFPQALALAASWNPDLEYRIANRIREHMRLLGAHHALAPVLDVSRDPRWGRTEETFGEDPYLASQFGIAFVKGLQGNDWTDGVMATGKHFLGYAAGEGGMNWAPAHIPVRELHETYLTPFEAAIRVAGLASIMHSYGELDGVPCAASRALLTDTLRGSAGFAGLVVSDYFGLDMLRDYHWYVGTNHEAARAALVAGLDVELPTRQAIASSLVNDYEQNKDFRHAVERAVREVLGWKFRLGLFDKPYVDEHEQVRLNDPENRNLAYESAVESVVLLKNDNSTLPLCEPKTIAVIGPHADNARNLIGDYSYPSHLESLKEIDTNFDSPAPDRLNGDCDLSEITTITEGIRNVFGDSDVLVRQGCAVLSNDTSGFADAVDAARRADVAVVCVGDRSGLVDGCTTGESRDRERITLPGVQQQLVAAIAETGVPIVLVLVVGRPVQLTELLDQSQSILVAFMPGQEGGRAIADVIAGVREPGGRLPMSFPRSVGQIPTYYAHKPSGGRSHWAGQYVEQQTDPLFPFGYGLSYTEFRYSEVTLSDNSISTRGALDISVTVTNTGRRTGVEVVQLYLRYDGTSVTRPVQELKGFSRCVIDGGDSQTIRFRLDVGVLAFMNQHNRWVVEPGTVTVMIGRSARDIVTQDRFEIFGSPYELPERSVFSTAASLL